MKAAIATIPSDHVTRGVAGDVGCVHFCQGLIIMAGQGMRQSQNLQGDPHLDHFSDLCGFQFGDTHPLVGH